MTVYVFPGQGSQTLGMGQDLFHEFHNYVGKANNILGYSIEDICLKDPQNQLNQTDYTQPLLYTVNALTYLKKIQESPKPTFVAGHSLGEYNALFAAGVFDFETGLKLVQKRGELMAQAENGGMAAVIGLNADAIQKILEDNAFSELSIANYNSYTQIVITGKQSEILEAKEIFEKSGASLYIPLKVSGAFHSPLMNKAAESFESFINSFELQTPNMPVIANVNAKPYEDHALKLNLVKQMTHSVLWYQSIDYLLAQGETQFEEIGPGRVLTGIIKKIQQGR